MTHVATFEEWKESQLKTIPHDQQIPCVDCDGEGHIHKECDCCGHEKEEECGTCDEDGTVLFGDMSDNEKDKYLSRTRYLANIEKDITDLAAWTGKDRIPMLLGHGLTVYSSIKDKIEKVVTIDHAQYINMPRGLSHG